MTVTIESALTTAQASAKRLREAVGELTLTAVEDRPRGTEVHLVTVVHDAALEVAAQAEQAEAALQSAQKSLAASAIADCQAHVHALGVVLVHELATPERLSDLTAFTRERGREARAWAGEIVRCIETCQHLLWTDIQPALLCYWRELADTTNRTRMLSDDR
ncbi:MAG: hypothetical protein QOC62_1505 [Mycobacterium sp.]|jgi:hypothetical protein|nr:hypothetical protein [Mycobacterium sp.]